MTGDSSDTRSVVAVGQTAGLLLGLAVTAMSMASGFIWATQGKVGLVYVAGFTSWSGYLTAHYASIGVFVDDATDSEETTPSEPEAEPAGDADENQLTHALRELRAIAPDETYRAIGFVAGIGILVAGIAILAWFVRQESHLFGNVGSGMFLGGYVIAHYFDTGKPL